MKKQRLDKLLELKAKCKKDFALSMVGKDAFFLFEEVKDGYATGYTENYLRVYVEDFCCNKEFNKVKIIEPYMDGAKAIIVR